MAEDTGRLAERLAKLEGLLEGMLPHLATKADVQAVRDELSADVQAVRDELSADVQTVREGLSADVQTVREGLSADVQAVREELSSVKYDTLWLKRLFWVGVVAVLIPLFRDLLGFLP